ncbi:hypothetical protein JCM10213_006052 [Rhodosporidiobolus nylandii]
MAAQSGIAPTQEMQDAWTAALADQRTRLVKISIKDEQLVLAGSFPTLASSAEADADGEEAFERDWALFQQDGVVEEKVPAYYLFRLAPPPSSPFLFLTYVPDSSPVRLKMLYASSSSTLRKALSLSSSETMFTTSPSELTFAAYEKHREHEAAERPRTEREEEARAVREAERREREAAEERGEGVEGGGGRSIIFGGVGAAGAEGGAAQTEAKGVLPWSDEAKEAVRALGADGGGDEGKVAILEIDLQTETVVLAPSQPSKLSLPPSSPCYCFYRHRAGLVLIYSCPPTSPIKSRLVYSSAALVLYKVAVPNFTGLRVSKKLETDDPLEVTPTWVTAELGPLATPSSARESTCASGSASAADGAGGSASGSSTPSMSMKLNEEDQPKFKRPARPGRRR